MEDSIESQLRRLLGAGMTKEKDRGGDGRQPRHSLPLDRKIQTQRIGITRKGVSRMMTGTQRIKAFTGWEPHRPHPHRRVVPLPLVDRNVTDFTWELIASTDLNKWDFIKIMTNGHFYTEAYGGDIAFSNVNTMMERHRQTLPHPLRRRCPNLPVLDIDNPVWQRELKILRNLKDYYQDRLPIVATIFNPLTAVQECAGCLDPVPMLHLMAEDP